MIDREIPDGRRLAAGSRPRLVVALALLANAATFLAARSELVSALAALLALAGVFYLYVRLTLGPVSRFVARRGVSIRWKVLAAICVMALPFLVVSLINFEAMAYMHDELHRIQELRQSDPRMASAAVDALERAQHTLLFSRTLLLGSLAALLVLGLGVAISLSVVEPVRAMAQAMRRIAKGDFSQSLRVENKDELGELAERINGTARDLAQLHEATVAAERSHALRERMAQVTLAQEEERRRISRELHDDLGPSLAAIANRLRASQQAVRTDPQRVEKELEEVSRSLKDHIQGIRALTYDLRPMALDQLGLAGALRQHVERVGQETGLKTSLSIAGESAFSPLVEVTVFRIAQECLNNVRKHANASQVEVRLQRIGAGLELAVEDDGRGFEPQAEAAGSNGNGGRLGLLSMTERAELLGGNLTVQSSPGRGCRVLLSIPSAEVGLGAL